MLSSFLFIFPTHSRMIVIIFLLLHFIFARYTYTRPFCSQCHSQCEGGGKEVEWREKIRASCYQIQQSNIGFFYTMRFCFCWLRHFHHPCPFPHSPLILKYPHIVTSSSSAFASMNFPRPPTTRSRYRFKRARVFIPMSFDHEMALIKPFSCGSLCVWANHSLGWRRRSSRKPGDQAAHHQSEFLASPLFEEHFNAATIKYLSPTNWLPACLADEMDWWLVCG